MMRTVMIVMMMVVMMMMTMTMAMMTMMTTMIIIMITFGAIASLTACSVGGGSCEIHVTNGDGAHAYTACSAASDARRSSPLRSLLSERDGTTLVTYARMWPELAT